jgi:hypothetical protein
MVTLPRDVNDGRAIVAHELDALPPNAARVAHALASAVTTGNWPALSELLHDEVDFRGLTTVRAWLAVGPDQMCAVLREWSAQEGRPAHLAHVDVASISDRYRVTYRLQVSAAMATPAVSYEHTAYFDLDAHERITFVRMLSSGAGGTRRWPARDAE